jgi:hypothetical protein
MADPHFAIVIKADGAVPFDEGLSAEHRREMLGHLIEMGHQVEHHDQPHPLHGGVSHAQLVSGPHAAFGAPGSERLHPDEALAAIKANADEAGVEMEVTSNVRALQAVSAALKGKGKAK